MRHHLNVLPLLPLVHLYILNWISESDVERGNAIAMGASQVLRCCPHNVTNVRTRGVVEGPFLESHSMPWVSAIHKSIIQIYTPFSSPNTAAKHFTQESVSLSQVSFGIMEF